MDGLGLNSCEGSLNVDLTIQSRSLIIRICQRMDGGGGGFQTSFVKIYVDRNLVVGSSLHPSIVQCKTVPDLSVTTMN